MQEIAHTMADVIAWCELMSSAGLVAVVVRHEWPNGQAYWTITGRPRRLP